MASNRVILTTADGKSYTFDNVVDLEEKPTPAPTVSLTASPSSLGVGGGAVSLAWSATDMSGLAVADPNGDRIGSATGPGYGSASGTISATLSATGTFTATAIGPDGQQATATAPVTVAQAGATAVLDGATVANPVAITTWVSGDHYLTGDGTTQVEIAIPGFYPEYLDACATPPAGPRLTSDGWLVFTNNHSGGWSLYTKGVASVSITGNGKTVEAPMAPVGSAGSGAGSGTGNPARSIAYPTAPVRTTSPATSRAALEVRVKEAAGTYFNMDVTTGKTLDSCQNPVSGRTVTNAFAFDLTTTLGAWFSSDGVRNEIVFSLGADAMDVANHGPDTLVYTAEILKAGTVVATFNIGTDTPAHARRQEWVWEDQPQEISLAALQTAISSGFLPPYSVSATTAAAPNPPKAYAPMGFGSMAGYEPTTGGRPELAEIEGWLAYILAQLRAGNTNVDLTWITTIADCCASENLHFTDFETMGPVDPRKYAINFYSNGPTKLADGALVNISESTPQVVLAGQGSSVIAQTAHSPDLLLLAIIATGNPRYVRWAQQRAIFHACENPPSASALAIHNEPRGNYWGLRNCHVAAWARRQIDSTPAWLLDSPTGANIGDTIRDNTITWMLAYANAPAGTPAQVFAAYTDIVAGETLTADMLSPTPNVPDWENNGYGAPVLAWLTTQGVANARAILIWLVRSAVAQAAAGIYQSYWPVFVYMPWDPTRIYGSGDRCFYGSAVYSSLVTGNIGITPDSDPAKWSVVAGAAQVCTAWPELVDCSNTQTWTGDSATLSPPGQLVVRNGDYNYPVMVKNAMTCATWAALTDTDIPGLSAQLSTEGGLLPLSEVPWEQSFA